MDSFDMKNLSFVPPHLTSLHNLSYFDSVEVVVTLEVGPEG